MAKPTYDQLKEQNKIQRVKLRAYERQLGVLRVENKSLWDAIDGLQSKANGLLDRMNKSLGKASK